MHKQSNTRRRCIAHQLSHSYRNLVGNLVGEISGFYSPIGAGAVSRWFGLVLLCGVTAYIPYYFVLCHNFSHVADVCIQFCDTETLRVHLGNAAKYVSHLLIFCCIWSISHLLKTSRRCSIYHVLPTPWKYSAISRPHMPLNSATVLRAKPDLGLFNWVN